jgi:molybdate transport system substrate-binding protein
MVAVDANFIEPFKEIAELFETNTDIKVTPTFSSTGTLYTQITQGVPYDVFLSTDEKWPDDLYQKGFSEEPFVYAQGEVVLWSSRIDLCNAVFNAT